MKDDEPTLRDLFAMAALVGIAVSEGVDSLRSNDAEVSRLIVEDAKRSYAMADAMLAERSKEKPCTQH